jgi:hypothetical protein
VFAFTGNGSGVYQQTSSQTPDKYWGNILNYVLNVLKADPNRIYLAGLSGGGCACFDWITTSQSLNSSVAAVLPASPMAGNWLTKFPTITWANEMKCWGGAGTGSGDLHFLGNLKKAIQFISVAGGEAKITEYAGAGHSGAVWEPFYTPEGERWPWMLSHSNNSDAPPPLTVISKYEMNVMSDKSVTFTKVSGLDQDLSSFPKQL